jgi:K+-transporting ATPase KdpF subunit
MGFERKFAAAMVLAGIACLLLAPSSSRAAVGKSAMPFDVALAGIVSLVLIVYLVFALLNPEKF